MRSRTPRKQELHPTATPGMGFQSEDGMIGVEIGLGTKLDGCSSGQFPAAFSACPRSTAFERYLHKRMPEAARHLRSRGLDRKMWEVETPLAKLPRQFVLSLIK